MSGGATTCPPLHSDVRHSHRNPRTSDRQYDFDRILLHLQALTLVARVATRSKVRSADSFPRRVRELRGGVGTNGTSVVGLESTMRL